jgi:hypothetical protein
MKQLFLLTTLSFLLSISASAQQPVNESSQVLADTTVSEWTFTADAYYYILPNEKNTTTLISTAEYKALHIEARYNYEDDKTASLFGGYRFETGKKVIVGATPMMGVVFGNTNAIAPGLLLDITFKKFDFYSESEYLFDFAGKENNYFYTWSELAITPIENFRTGISANRTRLFSTGLDFQRGIFAQYLFWKLTAGVYYFNPFTTDDFVIATLGIEF